MYVSTVEIDQLQDPGLNSREEHSPCCFVLFCFVLSCAGSSLQYADFLSLLLEGLVAPQQVGS